MAGRIVAGRWVVLACQRHLRDLKRPELTWDPKAALWAIGFFREVLRLNGGQFEGLPFELLCKGPGGAWEAFVVGSLFGWKRADGARRFQLAYIEIGKGNGKSPLAAGIGHFMLLADGEARAEVYAAATKKDQAMVLFRDAVAMTDLSPELAARLKKSGTGDKVWNLYDEKSKSFFRPISSEDDGQSGPRPHCGLIDEVHEHRTATVVDMMRQGVKWRRQPLIIEITNSGFDRHSVAFQHHEYSAKVLDGVLENDQWFAYVCTLDACPTCRAEGAVSPKEGCPDCDDWQNEATWVKANPNLGVSIQPDYLRARVREAVGMPAVQNTVKRLNFCIWTEQSERAIDMSLWDAGAESFDPLSLRGRACFGGLDLARVNDLSAFDLIFPPVDPGEKWKVLCWFWVPRDDILTRAKRDRVPYDVWVRDGLITATEGNTTDFAFIEAKIVELAGLYDIQQVAFDRTFAGEIVQGLQREMGEERVLEFGQGFLSMAAPTAELLRLVKAAQLQHGGNAVLRWNASNLACSTDPAGNLKPDKQRSAERIDGISALCNAIGMAVRSAGPGTSIYETRGAIVL